MDWESVFAAYPVNQEFVWLNNCGTTPAGSHIVDAVSCFINKYSEKGILADTPSYLEVKERIKEIIADLLNCITLFDSQHFRRNEFYFTRS